MTDIARDPRTTAAKRPTIRNTDIDDSHLLPLKGDCPQIIVVRMTKLNDQLTPEFSDNPGDEGSWFTGGLKWTAIDDHPLFVTFQFAAESAVPITGMECALPMSPPYVPPGGTLLQQDMCILPVYRAMVDYHLLVEDSQSNLYDPKILVSPINTITDKRSGKA
jgi:hypothetical protein